ncbi:hypothetical protein KAU88_09630 [Candidatus Bathyarchaeota archaeon]|nr:hypothetical protein [Candidatus Bathyarchaeota archaeon]
MSGEISAEKKSKNRNEGPYETFVAERLTKARSHYFRTSDPKIIGGYYWMRIWVNSPLAVILTEAWNKGKKLKVILGYPYTSPDGTPTASVKTAHIIW